MRATNEASVSVDGDPDEEEDDESDVWAKATKTELMLREELALHKRLPRDIWKTKSLRNLIKLLLRVKKLLAATAMFTLMFSRASMTTVLCNPKHLNPSGLINENGRLINKNGCLVLI